ncbi:MAG: NAD(P)/FAD-dependent oxidoreductase [Alphaproteobacteria bacterium]
MHHVVVGAGPAGVIGAETLRRLDARSKITMIMDEDEAPYSRMAIPYFLADEIKQEGTHLRKDKGYWDKKAKVEYRKKTRVEKIDPKNKNLTLSDGSSLGYDKLLLATGAAAVHPPVPGLEIKEGIHHCWTLEDSRNIMKLAKPGAKVMLMGAGFIGCIILEALAKRGVDLTVVEMEDRMVPRMMNAAGGNLMKNWCIEKGVNVLTSTKVVGVEKSKSGSRFTVSLEPGKPLEADLIVVATGVKPITDFLKGSGIKSDFGIVVDEHFQTTVPDVYAAGDGAQGRDLSDGSWSVQAIQPTAVEHGRIAAQNMAGHPTEHRGCLNMNVLATVGLISSSYGLWQGVKDGDHSEELDEGAYRYMRLEFDGDKLVGALALGFTEHVGVLRGLIQTEVPLGKWKDRLMDDPLRVMEAYLAQVHLMSAQ